jgi:predicted transposase/invertase (TIGR01784 family)
MASHDHAYKALFSHPEMVRDLLDGFVAADWVAQLDYASLEKVNSTYVTDDLRGRSDDLVWRVKWCGDWIYVYLLMEFQSTVDPSMAVRMMAYVALLYQDLIKAKQLIDGRLPRVLPLVLYNGFVRWYAKDEVSALIHREPRALDAFQPYLRYLLIDERQYRESELAHMRNLAAVLFRLERADTSASIEDALRELPEYLRGPERLNLRRTFETLLRQIIFPRFARATENPVDVQHIVDHWARRVDEWNAETMRKGVREGESRMLLRQLEIRFGSLPEDVRKRVADAATEQLEGWAERVVSVGSLDAVFATDEPR